jgi:dipeptidyl aminopeptidase/acylaminoacyl peptidase
MTYKRSVKNLFATILLVCSTSIFAQNQLLTPEILWKIGRVGLECVSPDGKTAVYGVQRFSVEMNKGTRVLFSVNISTGATIKLTDETRSASDAEFRPDGTKIGYLQDGILNEINLDGSANQVVSKMEINGFHYAPDGKKILYTQDVKLDKTPSEIYTDLPKTSAKITDGLFYRHWKSWHDYKYSNVFIADYQDSKLSEGKNIMNERFDTPLQPMGGMEQIIWSSDGRIVYYTCRKLNGTEAAKSTNSDIYAYELASGKTLNITNDLGGYDQDPIASPDGRYLAWTSLEHAGNEADKPRLMLLDLQTMQRTDLTEKWDYEANHPQWAKDSKSIYFVSSTDFTYQVYNIVLSSKNIKKITDGRHDFQNIKITDNQIITSKVSMDAPAEIYAINPTNGQANQLTFETKNPWNDLKKGRVERRSVRTTDDKDMNVWVIYPPDFNPTKKYPAILVCQGGPQSALSQNFSYRWNYQLMAANGYIVIAPCRRGMPGSGKAWNDAISGDFGGQAMRDLLSATDAVTKDAFVDKNRVAAVGASFGGYSVYWLAGNHEKRFKSFISHCGMFNFESFYGTTEELWFVNHDFEGAYWETNSPTYYRDSPHRYVQNWNTPILVIHNELDFRVPFSEGMQAFQAAQLKGIKSKFLSFPDEGHWMSKPQNSILWQRVFFDWLKETM